MAGDEIKEVNSRKSGITMERCKTIDSIADKLPYIKFFQRPKSSTDITKLPQTEQLQQTLVVPEFFHPIDPADDVCFPHEQDEGGIDLNTLEKLLNMESSYSPFFIDNLLYNVHNEHSINQDIDDTNRFMFYSKLTGSVYAKSFPELNKVCPNLKEAIRAGNFWFDITTPNELEMKALSRIFHIHPLTVEDILTEEIREKCELFKQYYFVCFRAYEQNAMSPSYLDPVNVYNIILKEGILTFHSKPTHHISSVLRRISQLQDFITVTPDWINYAVIDDITDCFAPMMRHIELEVDTIDELVLILKESEQSDMLRRIGHARRKVTMLLRLLTSKPDVIKALISRCSNRIDASNSTDIKLYLGDIQDHLVTMIHNSLHFEKVLARAHSNYLAQISIELTQVSNKTNDVVAKLTAIASILLPMNVVTGLWGMNVHVPGGQDSAETDTYYWFFGIIALMFTLSFSFYIGVRRAGIV